MGASTASVQVGKDARLHRLARVDAAREFRIAPREPALGEACHMVEVVGRGRQPPGLPGVAHAIPGPRRGVLTERGHLAADTAAQGRRGERAGVGQAPDLGDIEMAPGIHPGVEVDVLAEGPQANMDKVLGGGSQRLRGPAEATPPQDVAGRVVGRDVVGVDDGGETLATFEDLAAHPMEIRVRGRTRAGGHRASGAAAVKTAPRVGHADR